MKSLFIILMIVLLTACTDEKSAMRALEAEGFESIEFTGYDFFACSEDDFYHTGFVAMKNGKREEGTVCSGLFFKGSTVRWK